MYTVPDTVAIYTSSIYFICFRSKTLSSGDKEVTTSDNLAYGQTKVIEAVGEGMYESIDDNPPYGEQLENEYELCDLSNPSS